MRDVSVAAAAVSECVERKTRKRRKARDATTDKIHINTNPPSKSLISLLISLPLARSKFQFTL